MFQLWREHNVKATTLCGIFFIAVAPCLAQIQAGRIVGTITDPNQAVVPNAKVVITNNETNQSQTLTTNGAGDFVLTPANPGTYRVEVSASGFGTSEVNRVEVTVGPTEVLVAVGPVHGASISK